MQRDNRRTLLPHELGEEKDATACKRLRKKKVVMYGEAVATAAELEEEEFSFCVFFLSIFHRHRSIVCSPFF